MILSEPPGAIHPVRGIGRYLGWIGQRLPASPPRQAVAAGATAWALGAAGSIVLASVVERPAGHGTWQRPLILGMGLWPLFAQRMLLDEVAGVEAALADNLPAGRDAVARLVSRDVSAASAAQVRQAAIESLGENVSDSVVAPLLWFAAGGLPAAAFYRFVNTSDATWGYRTPRWHHAGLVAARADDLLNYVPARLTAVLLAGRRVSFAALRDQAHRAPSPNAGWPMAALALRLGIRLEKTGTYTLNPGGREPTATDTFAALTLAERRSWLAASLCAGLAAGIGAGWAACKHRRRPFLGRAPCRR